MLKVGDRVRFLDEVGGGTVIRLLTSTSALVRNADGMDFPMPITSLVVVSPASDDQLRHCGQNVALSHKIPGNKGVARSSRAGHALLHSAAHSCDNSLIASQPDERVVDLHAECLRRNCHALSAREIISLQLAHFEATLKNGLQCKCLRTMVFIHGQGRGRLRDEIVKILDQRYPKLRYHDAPFSKYGFGGAMTVYLK